MMPNWSDVLQEIQAAEMNGRLQQQQAFDTVRRRYLNSLADHARRNVIAYYSAFLSRPTAPGVSIADDDKNGFMRAVHQLDRTKGLDLILHTPGGNIAATESLIYYLRTLFGNDVRAIVPQISMSAGTMIACFCKSIVMGKHSNLGPIDPQVDGFPAVVIKMEFERAYNEIRVDPLRAALWQPIISRYPPAFLDRCDFAIKRASDLVADCLVQNMLSGKPNASALANTIVKELSDVKKHKAHDKHLHYEDCEKIGLKLERLEDDEEFQDLVLTVHHCFMHTMGNSLTVKIIENHEGKAVMKQVKDDPSNQISIGFGRPM